MKKNLAPESETEVWNNTVFPTAPVSFSATIMFAVNETMMVGKDETGNVKFAAM